MTLLYLILIPVGAFLILKGARLVVDTGVYIAKRTGIPRFVIGVTVVALGTSIPELIIAVISGFQGKTELIVGNILGSNISNILFVIGVAAIIMPIQIKRLVATRDIPFSFASIFIFGLLFFDQLLGGSQSNILSRADGLILLIVFLIFIYYVAFSHKEYYDEIEEELTHKRFINQLMHGTVGILLLVIGGVAIVQGSVEIAELLGLTERVIGLTIVAIGTSLPELATIIVAIKNNEEDLGLGNIIGSNIFNLLFIMGTVVMINPISPATDIGLDIFILSLATVLLIVSLFLGIRGKVDRTEGVFFVIIYLVYLISQLGSSNAIPVT